MFEKGLVSVITPCYNVGKVVHRLFDSILGQTYKKIEFIIVNDGSTDNTEEVVEAYIPRFKEAGVIVKYIFQENKGLGGAIDAGLKMFTGEYLCWPDADDYLSKDSIEKRKNFLDRYPHYQLVCSDAYIYNEDNLNKPIGFISGKKKNRFREDGLFVDYIIGKDAIVCPGCHMVRSSAFIEVNPLRKIYPARRGQNLQMLLPLLYKFRFAYIDEPLYNYIQYSNSMSKGDSDILKCVERYEEIKEILLETLKIISIKDTEDLYFKELIDYRYYELLSWAAIKFGEISQFLYCLSQLKKLDIFTGSMRRKYYIGILKKMYRYVRNKIS